MYNEGQAKLYYLYMMSDEDVSENEKKIFLSICKELYIDEDDMKRIIEECEDVCEREDITCIDILEENAEKGYDSQTINLNLCKYESDKDKSTILWNLVNLGFADKAFSFDEREVVKFLCEYWEVKDSIYNEMIDVAETILVLEEKKNWLEKTLPESDEKRAKLRQIKKDIKYVQKTIETTISEMDN